jgi:hypothetical protein
MKRRCLFFCRRSAVSLFRCRCFGVAVSVSLFRCRGSGPRTGQTGAASFFPGSSPVPRSGPVGRSAWKPERSGTDALPRELHRHRRSPSRTTVWPVAGLEPPTISSEGTPTCAAGRLDHRRDRRYKLRGRESHPDLLGNSQASCFGRPRNESDREHRTFESRRSDSNGRLLPSEGIALSF